MKIFIMKFHRRIVFTFAILYGLIARVESDLDLYCQSDIPECKCDFYTGTLSMDCSEMLMESVPNFLGDKVNAKFNFNEPL